MSNVFRVFLIFTIITVACSSMISFSAAPTFLPQSGNDEEIPIYPVTDPVRDTLRPRSAVIVPLLACLSSSSSSIIVTFSRNLGTVEVEALNVTTGENDVFYVDGRDGLAVLTISGDPGHWTVSITIESRTRYQREFNVE